MQEVGAGVVDSSSDDYEHFPDDSTQLSAPSAVSGYDSHNGLRQFEYQPANGVKKKEDKESPKVAPPPPAVYQPVQPPQYQAQPVQYIHSYSPYAPHMAYPAPAYYGYPQGGMPMCPPGYAPVYVPAPATAPAKDEKEEKKKEEKKPKKEKAEVKKWQGRTKAEVEEDNMKVANEEGAYDARKVEPVGLKADQMVWVVEGDGSHSLR